MMDDTTGKSKGGLTERLMSRVEDLQGHVTNLKKEAERLKDTVARQRRQNQNHLETVMQFIQDHGKTKHDEIKAKISTIMEKSKDHTEEAKAQLQEYLSTLSKEDLMELIKAKELKQGIHHISQDLVNFLGVALKEDLDRVEAKLDQLIAALPGLAQDSHEPEGGGEEAAGTGDSGAGNKEAEPTETTTSSEPGDTKAADKEATPATDDRPQSDQPEADKGDKKD